MLEFEFPRKLGFLLNEPALYKVIYGGRGGLKTETASRALVILATQRKLRMACFREIQKSIKESVFQTIESVIDELNLTDEFDIQSSTIISKRTGAEFIFSGLRYNINSIKSLARIDIAWIEEAANVSKTSWDKLEPTIRGKHDPNDMGGPFGKGPEIWLTFNPELDSDETYQRFVVRRNELYPDYVIDEKTGEKIRYCISIKTSYKDNKWLPRDLQLKIQVAKAAAEKSGDWTDFLHVYEGNTKQVLDGAIYAEEIKKVLIENRRGKVQYDSSRSVHTFWDLGHDDYTSIWFIQQVGMEYNLIYFFQDRLKKIAYYIEHLQSLKYNYGKHYLPHDADNETLSSRSVARIMRDAYPGNVKVVPRVAQKVLGIRAGRQVFDLCNFDEENTSEGWQCLCRYQYEVDEDGKFSPNPLHNEYSHGADAFQTFALSLKPEIATKKKLRTVSSGKVITINRSQNSWMTG